VLAIIAVGVAFLGGVPFVLFWAAAALVIFWEWSVMVAGGAVSVLGTGSATLALAAVAAGAGWFGAALALLAAGTVAVALLGTPRRRGWGSAGVLYAGTLVIAPLLLRRDSEYGLIAVLFLFAVVWATDIFAYLVGRAVGGPKLAPRVSPNKTWSGAGGGVLAAVLAGISVIWATSGVTLAPLAAMAFALSVASQCGDLLESGIKRRFDVKDTSGVIPGHGGLMDRLDGFIIAAAVAALVGLVRSGPDASARGLLLW